MLLPPSENSIIYCSFIVFQAVYIGVKAPSTVCFHFLVSAVSKPLHFPPCAQRTTRQHRTQQSNNEPDGCQVSSILAILSVWAENKTFAVMLDHSRTVRTQMLEKRCRFHKMLPVCQWKLLVSRGGFLNPRDDVERAQLSGIEPWRTTSCSFCLWGIINRFLCCNTAAARKNSSSFR